MQRAGRRLALRPRGWRNRRAGPSCPDRVRAQHHGRPVPRSRATTRQPCTSGCARTASAWTTSRAAPGPAGTATSRWPRSPRPSAPCRQPVQTTTTRKKPQLNSTQQGPTRDGSVGRARVLRCRPRRSARVAPGRRNCHTIQASRHPQVAARAKAPAEAIELALPCGRPADRCAGPSRKIPTGSERWPGAWRRPCARRSRTRTPGTACPGPGSRTARSAPPGTPVPPPRTSRPACPPSRSSNAPPQAAPPQATTARHRDRPVPPLTARPSRHGGRRGGDAVFLWAVWLRAAARARRRHCCSAARSRPCTRTQCRCSSVASTVSGSGGVGVGGERVLGCGHRRAVPESTELRPVVLQPHGGEQAALAQPLAPRAQGGQHAGAPAVLVGGGQAQP
ncbi:hypothetical protein LV78_007946 [Actinosynnema pretiosum]|nr:hypothetical protein [Actinosynnema pretiosum]